MRTLVTVFLIVAALAVAYWGWKRYAPASMGGGAVALPAMGGGAIPSTIGAGIKPPQPTITSVGGQATVVIPGFKA